MELMAGDADYVVEHVRTQEISIRLRLMGNGVARVRLQVHIRLQGGVLELAATYGT